MTESLVIAVIGGAAGLVVAWCGACGSFAACCRRSSPALPGIAAAGLDPRALAATLGFSLVTGLVFGVLPALAASDSRVAAALSEEARGSSGSVRARRLRAALVVVELALSLVLLAGAALLLVSFNRLINVSPGFQPAQLVVSQRHAAGRAIRRARADRRLLRYAVRAAARRARCAACRGRDIAAVRRSGLAARSRHRASSAAVGEGPVSANPRLVSTDYFATLGIPLVRGRFFTEHDSESSPTGRQSSTTRRRAATGPTRIRSDGGSASAPTDDWREIVGVVGDTRDEGLDADADPAAYLPQHQLFSNLGAGFERTMTIVIRSSNDAAANASIVRSAVSSRRSAAPDRDRPDDGRRDRRFDCAAPAECRARLGVRARGARADRAPACTA